jgi:hypothetical protein
MKLKLISVLTYFAAFTPLLLLAQQSTTPTILQRFVNLIVNPAIYFLFALAALIFVWGVFQYVMNAEASDARVKGGQHILWGVVGLTIMTCVFVIIRIITATVGADTSELKLDNLNRL